MSRLITTSVYYILSVCSVSSLSVHVHHSGIIGDLRATNVLEYIGPPFMT